MIRSKTRLAIVALGLVAIVAPAPAAATAPAYPATAAAPVPHAGTELRWRPCGDNVECATLRVPLDYARPRAATIGIALARIPAETTGRRLGTLMLMPGGPGGSGVQLIKELAQIPPGVLGGFDMVGFDPAGSARARRSAACQITAWTCTTPRTSPRTAVPKGGAWWTCIGSSRQAARAATPSCSVTWTPPAWRGTWTASGSPWANTG